MPGYQWGDKQPLEVRARHARAKLDALHEQITEREATLAVLEGDTSAARARLAPFLSDTEGAERAYNAAMQAHPDNITEGPKRLALLNRELSEARHLKAVS